jgi:hypothetical protein
MPGKDDSVLYDGPPIRTRMVAWLLLGTGGIVLVPIGLINRAWWLLVPAVPLLLAGLVLFQAHLRVAVEPGTGEVCVTNRLLGLKIRQRRYPPSEAGRLDLQRVAGDERERPSDTWYLYLQLGTRVYTIGKYDSQASALRARLKMREALQAHPRQNP